MRPGVSNARVHGHRIRSVRLRQQLLDDVIEDLVRHVLLRHRLWSCHSMIGKQGLRDTAMLQGHEEDEQEIATVRCTRRGDVLSPAQ